MNPRMRIPTNVLLCSLLLMSVCLGGCRDPEFPVNPWGDGNYDPSDPNAEPAPLCPPNTMTFNNSIAAWEGGEESVALVVDVFTYFRCPNCAGLSKLIEQLLEDRQDIRDNVRFYIHHFPLYEHKTAMELHAASIAAQDQGMEYFWKTHDLYFEGLTSDPVVLWTAEDIADLAENEWNLDMDRYNEIFEGDEVMQQILWDKSQGQDVGLLGTPGVFICGNHMGHWDDLEENIDYYLQ